MIYFDNAATTKCCNEAKRVMEDNFDLYGNSFSSYKLGRLSKKIIDECKYKIAGIIGCSPAEIYFTSGGSESDTWAIVKTVSIISNRKTIITCEFEHSAVLKSFEFLEKSGYNVIYLRPNSKGVVESNVLKSVMTNDVALVSIMLINNELGTIQPIEELSRIAHQYGALFHCDAVQAVGHINVNVNKLGVDLLSASAHKFYGPKGIGFLYKKENVGISSLVFGGHQQNGIRPGTENTIGILGLTAALEYSASLIEKYLLKIKELKRFLIERLDNNKIEYQINGAQNYDGIISLCILGIDNEALVNFMDLHDIYISYGSACNTGVLEPSHVLKCIGLRDEEANSTIRLSFSIDNTTNEIFQFVEYLKIFIDLQMN